VFTPPPSPRWSLPCAGDAWRGGAVEGESSFPQTDGDDLAADKMFFAALASLSRVSPQAAQDAALPLKRAVILLVGLLNNALGAN